MMTREPAAILATIGALLASVAKLAVLMGWVEWDAEQLAGVSLVIDNALLVIGTLLLRSVVTPTADPVLEVGASVNHGHASVVAKDTAAEDA